MAHKIKLTTAEIERKLNLHDTSIEELELYLDDILDRVKHSRKELLKNFRITKCYLIERIDKEGNELESEYVFGTRKDAEEYALNIMLR